MTRFVALLRAVNVGGRNRLPMAELRAALSADGLTGARTHIQSGNVVFDAPTTEVEVAAARVRSVIARGFGLDVPVVGLTAGELSDMAKANPFSAEGDPRRVHAIVLPHPLDSAGLAAVSTRQDAALARGNRDAVVVAGRVAYLHTPDGFGTSDLAKALASGRSSPLADGTARNWATITTLLDMCEVDSAG